jgi:predicted small lipoprotein YifL
MILKRFWLVTFILLTLVSCGRKGPVRPLLQTLPAAPQNLTVQQQGLRFLIAWSLPPANQDGTPLTDLQGFQIFKMTYDPLRECPECRDTSTLMATVELDYLRDVRRSGDRFFLWDTGLDPGIGYQYRVVPMTRKGRNGIPALTRRPFLRPPAPPQKLVAVAHDQLVRLTWEPAEETRPDLTQKGYNLYRRAIGETFSPQPVNRDPLVEAEFEDFGLENGKFYFYAVRSVAELSGHRVESPLSGTVEALPKAGH